MTEDQTPAFKASLGELLSLRMAQAIAAAEASLATTSAAAEVLQFLPRAASTGLASLPDYTESENDDSIGVQFSKIEGRIEVRIETLGFHRIDELEGRQAHFSTLDGRVAYTFSFSEDGTAEFSLDDQPGVVASLQGGWKILIAPEF